MRVIAIWGQMTSDQFPWNFYTSSAHGIMLRWKPKENGIPGKPYALLYVNGNCISVARGYVM